MQTVILRPLFHRGQEVIAVEFSRDREIEIAVRKLKALSPCGGAGGGRSQTHKVWHLPLSKETDGDLTEAIKPFANVDNTRLTSYLEKRKKIMAVQASAAAPTAGCSRRWRPVVAGAAWRLSPENLAALNRFLEQLKLKAYSASTVKTYRNEFLQLLQVLKQKAVTDLTPDDLRRYFVYCLEKLKLSENTLHSRINAVKFYFEQVLGREKFLGDTASEESRKTSALL